MDRSDDKLVAWTRNGNLLSSNGLIIYSINKLITDSHWSNDLLLYLLTRPIASFLIYLLTRYTSINALIILMEGAGVLEFSTEWNPNRTFFVEN